MNKSRPTFMDGRQSRASRFQENPEFSFAEERPKGNGDDMAEIIIRCPREPTLRTSLVWRRAVKKRDYTSPFSGSLNQTNALKYANCRTRTVTIQQLCE